MQDTREKIKSIAPLTGQVLDTATGLGYTAITAAETAESVTTIELDPTVLEIGRLNPWSQDLFDNPRIDQRIGDAWDVIETLPDESYSRILHDPPVFSLAGHLYSGDFYRELYRVLKRNGRLFHYIGDPNSKSGRNTTRGVIRRLHEARFNRVVPKPKAFGVAAYKR
jgi:predicted methyltransferase